MASMTMVTATPPKKLQKLKPPPVLGSGLGATVGVAALVLVEVVVSLDVVVVLVEVDVVLVVVVVVLSKPAVVVVFWSTLLGSRPEPGGTMVVTSSSSPVPDGLTAGSASVSGAALGAVVGVDASSFWLIVSDATADVVSGVPCWLAWFPGA